MTNPDQKYREVTVIAKRNVSIRGVIYPTVINAAKETKISVNTIYRYVADPRKPDFYFVYHGMPVTHRVANNEGRIHTPQTRARVRQAALLREARKREESSPISVRGVVYNTRHLAAKATGLSEATIRRYIVDPRKTDFFHVDG